MPSDEISRAVAALAEAGRARQPGEPVLAMLDCALMRITLRYEGLRAWAGMEAREGLLPVPPERPAGVPACGLWLSEVEDAIVAAASPDEWRTAEALALATGNEPTNHFRSLLKNLGDRRVLVSSPRGYRRASG